MSEHEDQKSADTATGRAPTASAPVDYETATERLDEIIARLDSGDAQLRETLDLCAEAKTLIEYCAAELSAVDEGLKELRLEDLAASLQTGPAETGASATGGSGASGPSRGSGSSTEPSFAGEPPLPDEPPPPEEPPF
jgi:exodeoxyribonuclease VII small subunit